MKIEKVFGPKRKLCLTLFWCLCIAWSEFHFVPFLVRIDGVSNFSNLPCGYLCIQFENYKIENTVSQSEILCSRVIVQREVNQFYGKTNLFFMSIGFNKCLLKIKLLFNEKQKSKRYRTQSTKTFQNLRNKFKSQIFFQSIRYV